MLSAPAEHASRELRDPVFVETPVSYTWLQQSVDAQDVWPLTEKGFATHTVEAWATIDDVPHRVGYVKIEHPADDLAERCENLLWYASHHHGWCIDLDASKERITEQMASYLGYYRSDHLPDDLDERYAELLRRTERKFDASRQETLARIGTNFVANAYVALDYQRRGIATAMYLAAAERLWETKQRPLVASGLQSDDAIELWKSLAATRRVHTVTVPVFGERQVLYPS